MCEASQRNSLKKNSALVVHFTSYFRCFFRHVQSTPPSSDTLPVCTTQLTGSAVKILSWKVNNVFLNVTHV